MSEEFYFPAGHSANSGLYRADPHPAGKVDHWLRPDGVTPHDRVYYEDDYSLVSQEEGQLSLYGFIWRGVEHFPSTEGASSPAYIPPPVLQSVTTHLCPVGTHWDPQLGACMPDQFPPESQPVVPFDLVHTEEPTNPLVYIIGGLVAWKLLQ